MLRPFDYHRPSSLHEACALLAELPDVAILAGGTDLLVKIRDGKHAVGHVVDLKRIAELEHLRREGDTLVIGALATVTELLREPSVQTEPSLQVLREAGEVFGCEEIRHRATICGNIAHASPGAEYGSPLYVLEGTAVIAGPQGERKLPIAEFYRGPGKNALGPGELLAALRVPITANCVSSYQRRSRVRGMDLAGLNLALLVSAPREPAQRRLRIAMGAVSGVPLRAPEVEALLSHTVLSPALLDEAKAKLSASINPRPSSLRATPAYKKAMVAHLLELALERLGIHD